MKHCPRVVAWFAIASLLAATAFAQGADEEDQSAAKLWKEVADAYRAAPAMTDELSLAMNVPTLGEMTDEVSVRVGVGRLAEFKNGFLRIVSTKETLFCEMEEDAAAIVTKVEEGTWDEIESSLGDISRMMPHHLIFRLGGDELAALTFLSGGALAEPAISGVETVEGMHVLAVEGQNGTMAVHVDPKTKLVRKATSEIQEAGMTGEEITITVAIACAPEIVESMDEPFEYDTEGLDVFDSIDEMMESMLVGDINPSVEVGSPAPGFSLKDQDGKEHSLEGYRGKVVLLDWWGIW